MKINKREYILDVYNSFSNQFSANNELIRELLNENKTKFSIQLSDLIEKYNMKNFHIANYLSILNNNYYQCEEDETIEYYLN